MGILERVNRIVRANLNQALDRADDPQKSLLLHIEEMRKGAQEARQELIKLGANEKLARRKYQECLEESRRWEERAVIALRAGDEDLARRALEYKQEIDNRAADYLRQADLNAEYVAQLKGQVDVLERKADLAHQRSVQTAAQRTRSEGETILAQRRADWTTSQPMPDPLADATAFHEFERMDDRISRLDAEMEALNELNAGLFDSSRTDLDRRFADLERESRAAGALDDLRRRLDRDPSHR